MPFFITPTADAFLQHLAEDAGQPLAFRIRINPASAPGGRIQVDLEEDEQAILEAEVSLQANGYRIVMDGAALDFLANYHMDYEESGEQAALTFHHAH